MSSKCYRRLALVAAFLLVPLLVTGCPECRMMLDAAVDQTKDLAEIVAEALRPRDAAPAPAIQPRH